MHFQRHRADSDWSKLQAQLQVILLATLLTALGGKGRVDPAELAPGLFDDGLLDRIPTLEEEPEGEEQPTERAQPE